MYRVVDPRSSFDEYVCPRCRFPVMIPAGERLPWPTCPRDGWPLVTRTAFSRSDGDPMLGMCLDGDFVPVELVASGATASVYRATRNGDLAAIKVLRLDGPLGETVMDAWEREVSALDHLQANQVVRMLDSGRITHPAAFFIALEWIPDRSLETLVEPLDLGTALELARQILLGLVDLHGRGVVHGDLKPANILAAWSEAEPVRAKLIDLGSSFERGIRRGGEALGWLGTPSYSSPERLSGLAADARTDLYSLGAVMHRLLLGTPPFAGPMEQVVQAHLHDPPPDLRETRPDLPQLVQDWVAKLLAKERAERPRSAEVALAELGRIALSK